MPYADPAEHKKYQDAYRVKHRDLINAHNRERYHTIAQTPEYKAKRKILASRSREARASYQRANRDKIKAYQIRREYGLTVPELETMKALQRGLCFICQQPMKLPQIDHDHTTNKVRALLCVPCNTSLGLMRENPDLLREAAAYLEAFNE